MFRLCFPLLLLSTSAVQCLAQDEPREPAPRKPPAIFSAQPLPIDKRDKEETQLLKERYNAAVAELREAVRWYNHRGNMEWAFDAADRVTTSKLAMTSDAVERVKVLQEMVEVAREVESNAYGRLEQGSGTTHDYQRCVYIRADWQLKVLREKKNVRAAK